MNRRDFLKSVGTVGASVALIGVLPSTTTADLITTDYKSMINIFLAGGNDSFNMLLESDESVFSKYRETRGAIALSKEECIQLNDNKHMVHASMPNIANLYNHGELAFLAGVGSLINPVESNDFKKPVAIGSHRDQQRWVNTLAGNDPENIGVAGRLADMINLRGYKGLPMNLSIGSKSDFFNCRNQDNNAYVLSTSGAKAYSGMGEDTDLLKAINKIHDQSSLNLLEKTYKDLFADSIDRSQSMGELLASSELQVDLTNTKSGLANSVKLMCKIIDLRGQLGLPRVTFQVYHTGYDTHSNQKASHKDKLYPDLDNAIGDLAKTLKSMGMYDKVTTFITADFGRTVVSDDNSGSDHGWSGNYFVLGGAVKGGKVYGQMIDYTNKDGLIQGNKLVPKYAWEQMMYPIYRWYGLTDTDIHQLLPFMGNFNKKALEFMKV